MSLKGKSTAKLFAVIRNGGKLSTAERVRLVVFLSVPAILTQVSNIAMEYIDASMVGHYGSVQAAAIGLVTTSTWLLWAFSSIFITGFTVQVAHRIGANKFDEAKALVRQAVLVVFLAAAVLAAISIAIHTKLPVWLGGSEEIRSDASLYFLIVAGTIPVPILGWLAAGLLRASGDVKTPSVISILMCVFNVIFNFLLIFPTRPVEIAGAALTVPGAGLGVAGAALGTFFAEALSALLMYRALLTRSPILSKDLLKGSFRPEARALKRALAIGVPVGSGNILMTLGQIITISIVAPLGTAPLAAHSLAISAEGLCYMPGYGVAEAATALTGQTIGAKRGRLARELAYLSVAAGMGVMAVMGALMFFGSEFMMRLLTNDPAVVALGASVLRIEAFAEPFFAAAIVCNGIFVGAGDTLKPVLINLASMWALRIPASFFLAGAWGLKGVWIAMASELCIRGTVFLARMKWGRWIRLDKID